jgi:TPR repeat protein
MKEIAKWFGMGTAIIFGSMVALTALPDPWVANYAFQFFGSPPNTEEGRHWLDLAAAQSNKDAQNLIAVNMLQNSPVGKILPAGNSAEENATIYQAIKLLKASDTPEAQLNLAICYFFGYAEVQEKNSDLLGKSKKLLEESPLPKAKELHKQLGMSEDSPSHSRGLYFYMLGYQHAVNQNIAEAGNMFLESWLHGIPEGASMALFLWKGRPLTTKMNINAVISLASHGNATAIELTQQLLVVQLAQLYLPILEGLQPYLPAQARSAYLQVMPSLSELTAKYNITFSAPPSETLQHVKTGLQQQAVGLVDHTSAIEKAIVLLNLLEANVEAAPPVASLDTPTTQMLGRRPVRWFNATRAAQMLNQALANFKQAGGVLPISNEVSSIIQRLLEGIATDQGERTFLSSDPPHTIEVNNEYYDLCYANERFFYQKSEIRQVPLEVILPALELWLESLWASFNLSDTLPAVHQTIPQPHSSKTAELWTKAPQRPVQKLSVEPKASFFWKIIFVKNYLSPRAGILILAGLGLLLLGIKNYRKILNLLTALPVRNVPSHVALPSCRKVGLILISGLFLLTLVLNVAYRTPEHKDTNEPTQQLEADIYNLAEKGNPDAQFYVGWSTAVLAQKPEPAGQPPTNDQALLEKASYWYEKASQQGHVEATYNLLVLHKAMGLAIDPFNQPESERLINRAKETQHYYDLRNKLLQLGCPKTKREVQNSQLAFLEKQYNKLLASPLISNSGILSSGMSWEVVNKRIEEVKGKLKEMDLANIALDPYTPLDSASSMPPIFDRIEFTIDAVKQQQAEHFSIVDAAHNGLSTLPAFIVSLALLTLYIGIFYKAEVKKRISKNQAATETPWQKLVQTAQKNEAEKKYLEVLGLEEVTELEEVYPALRKQSQRYSRRARKTMTPFKRKEAAKKMKLLEEAKEYFEQKFPRIWQAPTGKHRRYRAQN